MITSLLVVTVLVLAGSLVFFLRRPQNATELALLKQQMDLVREQVSHLAREMTDRLQENMKMLHESGQQNTKIFQEANRQVGERLDNAARVVGEVQNRLGKMEESNKKVFDVGKDIASLQEILRAPKLRGVLGELFLGDLLAQVLPKEKYQLQYGFKNGEKVDAIIHSAQGLICVDSKFPLENFLRVQSAATDEERKPARRLFLSDVKRHIDSIASKYILPDEGTLAFALMYIPAENVYYEIIIKNDELEKDILHYAQEKRVFPVSPNSFYAYLQTIAIGLRGMQMEEGVREVINDIAMLKKEFEKFGDDFRKIGGHLSNARGAYEVADKRFQRLGDKLETLGLPEGKKELRLLEVGQT